ncbi:MAG TPA: ROK family protein [Terriglobia bacterium]|nr:ROK family protein [Terriglobia bacterium]
MRPLIIGIDVGGTKVAGGLVTGKGRLVNSLQVPTRAAQGFEASFGQVNLVIERLIRRAGGQENVQGIGLCAPGPLDTKNGVILNAPNIAGWRKIPLRAKLGERFGLPIEVENDANAAGLAEVLFGAATGYRHVFYVTVSTGIGTGIIINRRIYHGKNGAAGEGGHVAIDLRSKYRCGCGALGHIEALASGPAMTRRARVKLEEEHTTASRLRELTHGNLSLITPEMIEKAAKAGDAVAKAVIERTGFYLGVWLAGMITLLDPEAIVMGGGVSRIGKPLFDIIRKTILRYTMNPGLAAHTPLLPAKLEKLVGVLGAASLLLPASEEVEHAF